MLYTTCSVFFNMMPTVGLDALRDTSRKQASLAFFCEEDLPKAKLAKEFEWELMG